MPRIAYWTLFGLTLAVYAVMLTWTLPALTAAAGGLVPFDMRPAGYGFAEARAFLTAVGHEGRAFYLGVQQQLDLFYPALCAATLCFSIVALLPPRLGNWRWLAGGTALPIAVFDYLENHAVAAMLHAGPEGLTPAMATLASYFTVLKSQTTTVVMFVLLGALIWRLNILLCAHLAARRAAA